MTKSKSIVLFHYFHDLPALFAVCLICAIQMISCAAAQNPDIDSAEAELLQGKYPAAIISFTRLLQIDPNDDRAQKGLFQAYLETGQYAEAERSAKGFLNSKDNEGQTRMLLGEVYAATGRYQEALAELEKARAATDAPTKLRSEVRRGELLEMTGKREAAQQVYQTVAGVFQQEDPETAEEMALLARVLTHLERYQEANDLYLEAIKDDREYLEAHLGGGELYTAKYNYAEAAEFFNDALKINPNSARALLGVALNKEIEGGDQMNAALAAALKTNPNYVEAKNFGARLDLEAERHSWAAKQLDDALKINPNSLEAHALRAAMFWLQNRHSDYENEVKATLAINPQYGMLYEVLGHFATQTRRYSESSAFLREAIKLSPRQWSSHLALGIALLRLGRMDEGRAELELSFQGDPFNIRAKNTLDLLDSMKEYRETKHGDFIIKVAAKENDVLVNYATELLDDAQRKLSAKYRFTPRPPIAVEIFPNHEDFAVRALGLPGLGALGVCFGQVIAQDSPSARPGGQFNWGTTLWHEYTHVITLQMTDHLIPRWFSEGLSVFEEHNARPGWGDDWSVGHLKALVDGKWFKISELDNGFIRPKRPEDVGLAYFEASQVCHFITDRYGFDAILDMLRGYREKKKTADILQQTLKLSESDFDREFNQYLRGKIDRYVKALEPGWKAQGVAQLSKEKIFAQAAEQPENFLVNLRAGLLYLADGKDEPAILHLRRSIELFPFQSGESNAYEPLAGIYEKQGNKAAAAEILEALVQTDENNYDALKKLAELKMEAGDQGRALELLNLSFYVNPFEHAAHTMAGKAYLQRNDHAAALREFRAALAANPPNLAEAHFNVATAYLAGGKNLEAKRAVLRALEIAPGFDKAQELLLKLTGNAAADR
ncbi:MAG TPA: tetratricopeptide repeat protein [Blastocatellia bacterium]|nr:tetratricopeptide repeat protein [Blastocatellia bacterium]